MGSAAVWIAGLLTGAIGVACGRPAAAPPPAPEPPAPVRRPLLTCRASSPAVAPVLARVTLETWLDGQPMSLLPGDALVTGDPIRLRVMPERTGDDAPVPELHVFTRDDDGHVERLAGPRRGPLELQAELDGETGPTVVWVVASREPLGDRAAALVEAEATAPPPERLFLAAATSQRRALAEVLYRGRGLMLQRDVASDPYLNPEIAGRTGAADADALKTLMVRGPDVGVVRIDLEHRGPGSERDLAFRPVADHDQTPLRRSVFAWTEDRDAMDISSPAIVAARLRADYPPGTAVLLYHLAGERLHAFLIDCNGLAAHAATDLDAATLEARITALRVAIVASGNGRTRALAIANEFDLARPPALDDAARALEQALLPADLRPALEGVQHLVVVPTYGIGTVPFPMLCPLRDGRCLVDQMSVSIAPSLFDLLASFPDWRWGFEQPLVIGNPSFAVEGLDVDTLPEAEAEARSVARLVGADPLVGDQATRAAFLDRLGPAELVYVASHALASAEDPMDESFLLLAGGRDSWVTPRQIQRQFSARTMSARLVVLSACQTGMGGVHRGGVVGFARAFQVAGAARVLMSQWNVDDAVTRELMLALVAELERHPPPEALRRAMLAIRKRYPQPVYWAPFLLFGPPN